MNPAAHPADSASAACPYLLKAGPFSTHGRVLEFLGGLPETTRILDVGAATGYLGAALGSQGFRSVSGIELNPAWAEQAKPHYEKLAVLDAERDPLPWDDESFEAVVLADFIEHVRDGVGVLKKVARLAAPGGRILISVPNVAHWSVRMSLLLGRFDYRPCGILDQGHLRFFTLKTARALIRDAGLALKRTTAIPLPIARWYNRSAWAFPLRAVEALDGGLASLWPPFFSYQFLLLARKE